VFTKLKMIRNSNHVSADKMAEILGLSTKSAYYKKENGRVKFTLSEAKKISDFFGISIEEIFFKSKVSYKERNQIDNKENAAS